MAKLSYRDLLLVLVLTILSVVWLSLPVLDTYPFNLIAYFLLLVFLSGYALLAAFKPLIYRIGVIRRVFYSVVLSFIVTLVVSLFSSFNGTSIHMFDVIPVLVFVFILIAFIRRMRAARRMVLERIKDRMGDYEPRIPVKHEDSEVEDLNLHLLGKLQREVSEAKKVNDVKVKTSDIEPEPVRSGKGFFAWDLVLISLFTILAVVFILTPSLSNTIPRTVLGLVLILFLPGYSLIAALFPRQGDLDSVERLALSFGLSIAVTPLLGLGLNYTSYGIRLDPILLSLSGFTLVLVLAAYVRRRLTVPVDRFRVDFLGFFKTISGGFGRESGTGKVLSVILVLSILLAVGATGYIIVKPKVGESFTEFYILGADGKASGYPTNLTSGESGNLIIGIVNHENKNVTYHLVVTSDGVVQTDQTVSLSNGQKLEIPFNFTAGDPGTRKMDFLLYKLPDNNNVYRDLHLWLNITTSTGGSTLNSTAGTGNVTG